MSGNFTIYRAKRLFNTGSIKAVSLAPYFAQLGNEIKKTFLAKVFHLSIIWLLFLITLFLTQFVNDILTF